MFSHDVTAAILVSPNNETAAILVNQTNPVGVLLFPYVVTFFCPKKFASSLATIVKTLYRKNIFCNVSLITLEYVHYVWFVLTVEVF